MKKALIDTNIVLDILLNRSDFYIDSADIYILANNKDFTGFVSAASVTDIFYIASKDIGKKDTKEALKRLLKVFHPATVTDKEIYKALDLDWDDFEDSVQYVVGESFSVDYIVTRNIQDFSSSPIPAVTPEQFIDIVTAV